MHIDMDAFFAAIEQLDQPELRGKAVLVGHDGPRGVVTTASYEARPYGCHSAQPMAVAKRLCPHAIVVPVRGRRYHEVSQQLFAVLDEFSPVVEPLSVDEAFLDAAGCEHLHDSARAMGVALKRRIREQLHLTASVGIAPNKFLAKLASDLEKPDGLTMIGPREIDTLLPALPITKIWGVGPATEARFAAMGIRTIGDLRRWPLERLHKSLGDEAEHFLRLAHGLDDRPVTPDREAKSIGHEQTFEIDLADAQQVRGVLLGQCEQVARRLRQHRLLSGNVTVKIRYGDFQTITRSTTLEALTDATDVLWQAARTLFDTWARQGFSPVRLIGVTAGHLSSGGQQMPLFADAAQERHKRIDQTADAIVQRFGKGAIRRAGTMRDEQPPAARHPFDQ